MLIKYPPTLLLRVLLSWVFFTSIAYAGLNLELPDFDLPEFGNSTATASQDSTLGLKVLRNFRKRLPVVEDPELSSWIQAMGNRLASKAPSHGKLYFLLLKNPDVNAFSSLGGVIVVNTGLVLQSDSESELAAVLAHEIAHTTQNHISRMISQSKSNSLGTSAAILAALVAGTQSPDAASAIITTAIAAGQHKQLAFSRNMEAEADRVGIRILSSAGFKASGMPGFMTKLDRLHDNPHAQLTKYLRSHPPSIERLSDTRSRAQQLKNEGHDNISFLYAREKIRGLMSTGLASQTPPMQPAITHYARAIKLISRGQNTAALQALKTRHPARLPEAIASAQSLNSTHQYQKTIKLLTPFANIRPGEPAILVPLSYALLWSGKTREAWQYLNQVTPTEQISLEYFEIKQKVATKMGYIADAYLAAAERNIRIGEFRHAIAQLQQAIKLPKVNAQDTARLQAKLKAVRQHSAHR